jgi:Leucine-rich repeat (LRR) protein
MTRSLFPRRWLPRFSLRTLFVAMTVLGVGVGLFGNFWLRLRQQRFIVGKIQEAGYQVKYTYEFGMEENAEEIQRETLGSYNGYTHEGARRRIRDTARGKIEEVEVLPGPRWLRKIFGNDAFAEVGEVSTLHPPGKFDPRLLSKLPRLKSVHLYDCDVSDALFAELARLPDLRDLCVAGHSGETTTSAGPTLLRTSQRLEKLTFAGDWLQDNTLASLGELRQLKRLCINNAPHLTSASLKHIGALVELRQLWIENAKNIDDQGTEHLANLTNLWRAHLHDTSISDTCLLHLSKLPHLAELYVSKADVGDLGAQHLGKITNLKRLSLDNTLVTDAGTEALAGLQELEFLDLSGTKITNASLAAIGRMTQLDSLCLKATSITNAGLPQLRTLTNLRELIIGPDITREAATELREAIPSCTTVQLVDAKGKSSWLPLRTR